jgi:hypothetical protein
LTTHSCNSHRDDGIRNRPKDGLRANDATMCVDQVLETLDPRPLRRIWRGRAPIASVEDEPENEWGSVVLEEVSLELKWSHVGSMFARWMRRRTMSSVAPLCI